MISFTPDIRMIDTRINTWKDYPPLEALGEKACPSTYYLVRRWLKSEWISDEDDEFLTELFRHD